MFNPPSSSSPAPSGETADTVTDALFPLKNIYHQGFIARLLDRTGNSLPMRFCAYDHMGRIHAYIEAKEGEEFSVQIIDSLNARCTYSAALFLGLHETVAQTLMFSKPAVTDDEANSIRNPAEVAGLGMISIIVRKVLQTYPCVQLYPQDVLGPQKAVYERTKQLGAVQISAGPTINKPRTEQVGCIYDDTFPPTEFVFHCTTRIGLQLNGIIPVETAPTAKQKRTREEEELDAEEQRLQKELENLKKRRRVIAGDTDNAENARPDENAIRVKREKRAFDFSTGGTRENPLTAAFLNV
ncbi:hypothetical protein A4X03_0g4344 [Tilletia caries]|uniref:Uncharacterized protein n=1 Tax=Tilletia caries TaxID=13290 RepID=A0A8T8TBR8_9BASI|nr:hypothetical protein A4X03_0g4344 [Tilletia caries]